MAGEHIEAEAHGTNGTSNGASAHSASRAAFMNGGAEPELEEAKDETADAGDVDDDSDLDAAITSDDEASDDADPDADADLDEEDDEDDEKDADKDDEKKGIDKVRRTEKRMREQLKKERADAETEIQERARRVDHELEQKWGPRIEAAERFEKLAARASVDPVAVLQALGVKEDAYEHIAQVVYTLAKAKDDPKARAAAAQLMKARERDAELEDVKKRLDEREKSDKERAEQAEADRQIDAFIGSVTKTVSDKMPLAKALMKNDPDGARSELQIVAFSLAKEKGKLPEAKDVAIAFEKHQRAKLRKLGIDPKSRGAAAAIVANAKNDSKAKPAPKAGDKKPAPKVDEKSDKSPRDEFIGLSH
jgi:hypothetical protein